jgi:DNA primase
MPKFPEIKWFKDKYGEKTLEESGIFSKGFGSTMFRERLIFPIYTLTGACVAIAGRALVSVENRKYINSPETPVFVKGKTLYNFNNALPAIQSSKSCYLVEGYFDAIRMASAGFENTVAMMGTAITKDRVSQLSRHAEEYNLLLDGDKAGLRAMEDSYKVALETDIYPNIILLPQGEDPDSFLAKNGADALKSLEKKDLIEYMIRRKFDGAADINAKFYRLDEVRKMLGQIKNPYRREYYINLASEIFDVNVLTLSADIGTEVPVIRQYGGKNKEISNITERLFLSLLLELPEESADKIIQEVPPEYLKDETARKLYEKVVELLGEDNLIARLAGDETLGGVAALLILESRPADIFAEIYDCKNRIMLTHFENHGRELVLRQLAAGQTERDSLLREFAANAERIKELRTRLKARTSASAQQ